MSFDHINEVFQGLDLEARINHLQAAYNIAARNTSLEPIVSNEYMHEGGRVAILFRTKNYMMDMPLFAISELRWDIIQRCLEELEASHIQLKGNNHA